MDLFNDDEAAAPPSPPEPAGEASAAGLGFRSGEPPSHYSGDYAARGASLRGLSSDVTGLGGSQGSGSFVDNQGRRRAAARAFHRRPPAQTRRRRFAAAGSFVNFRRASLMSHPLPPTLPPRSLRGTGGSVVPRRSPLLSPVRTKSMALRGLDLQLPGPGTPSSGRQARQLLAGGSLTRSPPSPVARDGGGAAEATPPPGSPAAVFASAPRSISEGALRVRPREGDGPPRSPRSPASEGAASGHPSSPHTPGSLSAMPPQSMAQSMTQSMTQSMAQSMSQPTTAAEAGGGVPDAGLAQDDPDYYLVAEFVAEAAPGRPRGAHGESGGPPRGWRGLLWALVGAWSPAATADAPLAAAYAAWFVGRAVSRRGRRPVAWAAASVAFIALYAGLTAGYTRPALLDWRWSLQGAIVPACLALTSAVLPAPRTPLGLSATGTATSALTALALSTVDLGDGYSDGTPLAFALGTLALVRAGESSAAAPSTSAGLLLVPPLYLAVAAAGAPVSNGGLFYGVHVFHFALLLAAACLAVWTIRQHEADWLRRLRAVLQSEKEERGADEILALMLPEAIIAKLKSGGNSDLRFANSFESSSVLFVEMCNFAALSALMDPAELVDMLNTVFSAFDALVESVGAYKVETVGPVYMVACGVPVPASDHVSRLCELALQLRDAVVGSTTVDDMPLQLRMGIHTGRVIGGIIGSKLPRYRLFGDTVNTASRMESSCPPGGIQLSEPAAALARPVLPPRYNLIDRGVSAVKGKGDMRTFLLDGPPLVGSDWTTEPGPEAVSLSDLGHNWHDATAEDTRPTRGGVAPNSSSTSLSMPFAFAFAHGAVTGPHPTTDADRAFLSVEPSGPSPPRGSEPAGAEWVVFAPAVDAVVAEPAMGVTSGVPLMSPVAGSPGPPPTLRRRPSLWRSPSRSSMTLGPDGAAAAAVASSALASAAETPSAGASVVGELPAAQAAVVMGSPPVKHDSSTSLVATSAAPSSSATAAAVPHTPLPRPPAPAAAFLPPPDDAAPYSRRNSASGGEAESGDRRSSALGYRRRPSMAPNQQSLPENAPLPMSMAAAAPPSAPAIGMHRSASDTDLNLASGRDTDPRWSRTSGGWAGWAGFGGGQGRKMSSGGTGPPSGGTSARDMGHGARRGSDGHRRDSAEESSLGGWGGQGEGIAAARSRQVSRANSSRGLGQPPAEGSTHGATSSSGLVAPFGAGHGHGGGGNAPGTRAVSRQLSIAGSEARGHGISPLTAALLLQKLDSITADREGRGHAHPASSRHLTSSHPPSPSHRGRSVSDAESPNLPPPAHRRGVGWASADGSAPQSPLPGLSPGTSHEGVSLARKRPSGDAAPRGRRGRRGGPGLGGGEAQRSSRLLLARLLDAKAIMSPWSLRFTSSVIEHAFARRRLDAALPRLRAALLLLPGLYAVAAVWIHLGTEAAAGEPHGVPEAGAGAAGITPLQALGIGFAAAGLALGATAFYATFPASALAGPRPATTPPPPPPPSSSSQVHPATDGGDSGAGITGSAAPPTPTKRRPWTVPAAPGRRPGETHARVIARWVLPRLLPWAAAITAVLFSQWAWRVGACFTGSAFAVTVLGCVAIHGLSFWTWMQAPLAAGVVLAHHAALVTAAAVAGVVDPGGAPESASAAGAAIAVTLTLAGVSVPVLWLLSRDLRDDEAEAREDFVAEYRAKHKRNVSSRIVRSMVPGPVGLEIRASLDAGLPPSLAWHFERVCIVQSDICEFTKLGARITPEALCKMLHELFTAFDEACDAHGVHKIETIGDAYLAATRCVEGGEQTEPPRASAAHAARLALALQARPE